MKKNYRLFTLISALAGYVGPAFIVWGYQANHGVVWKFALLDILCAAMICVTFNLVLWGIYFLEKWYDKKHPLKKWNVPSWCVIPGIVLNLVIVYGTLIPLAFVGADVLGMW